VTEPAPAPATGAGLAGGIALICLLGTVLDLFALLLLPLRVSGTLVPAGPILVLAANAGLGLAGLRLLRSTLPAKVLLALTLGLSVSAASSGPGGDLFVTRDLQGMYLLYIVTATFGACVPLLVGRPRKGGRP